MPCLHHKMNCPATLHAVRIYTHPKMCTLVLAVIPLKLNTTYHAGNQDNFVTDMDIIILQLKTANLNIKQTKGIL